ncbi:MAG: RNA polymerase sigma factor [Chthonomonadales bacterium]
MEQTDAFLVQRTLDGDVEAYGVLVQRYERHVYSLAYRMVGNGDDAADLVQDTFLRAFGALASFRRDASFLTWLYKIASNLCIDFMRARKSRASLSLDYEVEEGREPIADRSASPEDAAVRGAVSEVVQDAVLCLPAKYRVVVVMRHLQGLSIEEIAEQLQLPTGTVKTHLFRARQMLKERLKPVLGMETDGRA